MKPSNTPKLEINTSIEHNVPRILQSKKKTRERARHTFLIIGNQKHLIISDFRCLFNQFKAIFTDSFNRHLPNI